MLSKIRVTLWKSARVAGNPQRRIRKAYSEGVFKRCVHSILMLLLMFWPGLISCNRVDWFCSGWLGRLGSKGLAWHVRGSSQPGMRARARGRGADLWRTARSHMRLMDVIVMGFRWVCSKKSISIKRKSFENHCEHWLSKLLTCAPRGIRTHNPRLKRTLL